MQGLWLPSSQGKVYTCTETSSSFHNSGLNSGTANKFSGLHPGPNQALTPREEHKRQTMSSRENGGGGEAEKSSRYNTIEQEGGREQVGVRKRGGENYSLHFRKCGAVAHWPYDCETHSDQNSRGKLLAPGERGRERDGRKELVHFFLTHTRARTLAPSPYFY